MNTLMSRLNKYSFSTKRKEEILPSIVQVVAEAQEKPLLLEAPPIPEVVENVIEVTENTTVYVEPPPAVVEEPKNTLISPKNPDTLFWCLYIIANGYDEYLEIDRNYGVKELEIKKLVSDYVFANSYKFKNTNNKITKVAIQEIMSELLTSQKETSILCLIALTVYYNFNIIIVDSKEKLMLEFLVSEETEIPTFVLYKDSYGKYKVNTEAVTRIQVAEMKDKMFCLESYLKPLKSISNYKVEDLEALAKKMGVFDEKKKYKKAQLYEEVFAACVWK
jgi:hypothetical protein